MNESPARKYQSGREVLEHFIPGYVPSTSVPEEDTAPGCQDQSPEELKDLLLSGLRAKLDQLHFTNPSQ